MFVLNAWKNKFSTSKHITLEICFKIFVAHLLIQRLSRNYSEKDFLAFEGKKKSSGQHLGNIWQLGRKLSFCINALFIKINAWNEDFTSVFFFRNSHKCYWFKKNYQNKLLPSSMAWATPIIQVLINVFLLLFLLQIERHEVLLLHISFGRSP